MEMRKKAALIVQHKDGEWDERERERDTDLSRELTIGFIDVVTQMMIVEKLRN